MFVDQDVCSSVVFIGGFHWWFFVMRVVWERSFCWGFQRVHAPTGSGTLPLESTSGVQKAPAPQFEVVKAPARQRALHLHILLQRCGPFGLPLGPIGVTQTMPRPQVFVALQMSLLQPCSLSFLGPSGTQKFASASAGKQLIPAGQQLL